METRKPTAAIGTTAEESAEDDADVAVYDARKRALAAGEDVRLPIEVSKAVLRGKSLSQALSDWRKRVTRSS
jgi:hypothetical protein